MVVVHNLDCWFVFVVSERTSGLGEAACCGMDSMFLRRDAWLRVRLGVAGLLYLIMTEGRRIVVVVVIVNLH